MEDEVKVRSKFTQEFIRLERVMVSALERFYWDNLFSRAASLAYTTLLSLVPLTFVGFGFLTSLAVSNQELMKVREFIFRQFVPNQATVSIILSELSEIDRVINSSSFSVAATAFFAVTALLLINSIEYSLNEIWQVYEPRTISQRISIFCAIIVIGPVVAVTAYYTTKVRVEPFLMGIEVLAPYSASFSHILSFLVDFLAFFVLYFLVPKAPVQVSAAAFGAFITSVAFDLAKYYFTIYIVSFSSYDKLYGALAVIPIFLFWLYISWIVILFGCETCYQFQYLPRNGRIWKKQVTTIGHASLMLACQSLVYIGRAFKTGEKPPNELEISEKLGCSSLVLKKIIADLKSADILAQGDSREMPLIFQRSPERITVRDIHLALFPHDDPPDLSREVSRFFASLAPDGVTGESRITLEQLL